MGSRKSVAGGSGGLGGFMMRRTGATMRLRVVISILTKSSSRVKQPRIRRFKLEHNYLVRLLANVPKRATAGADVLLSQATMGAAGHKAPPNLAYSGSNSTRWKTLVVEGSGCLTCVS